MNRPAGIIFDYGETVLCSESTNFVAGSARLLEFLTHDSSLTAEELQSVANELNRELERGRNEFMIEYGVEYFYNILFETLGISLSISNSEAAREFWNYAVKFQPAEGIHEFLDMLEENRIKTGILSNSSFTGVIMEEELAKHNLAHRFSFLISSADYIFRKPSRRIYELAVRKMNLSPQDIWFVGDRLEWDIKGAISSGLCPIWYNPQNQPGNADYECLEVKSWHELREIIESL
jgi:HAD superfamily hydrolase (TIGR01549 family)